MYFSLSITVRKLREPSVLGSVFRGGSIHSLTCILVALLLSQVEKPGFERRQEKMIAFIFMGFVPLTLEAYDIIVENML